MNKQDKNHLDHAVERLLASRDRSKRQYFLQRVAKYWRPKEKFSRRQLSSSVFSEQAVRAVISFAGDDSDEVRRIVAQALGSSDKVSNIGRKVLEELLLDKVPLVRLQAAYSVYQRGLFKELPKLFVANLLYDSVWTIRWLAAESLANTDLHKKAWFTVIESVSDDPLHLYIWSQAAMTLADLRENKLQVKEVLEKCIASEDNKCINGWAYGHLDDLNKSLEAL